MQSRVRLAAVTALFVIHSAHALDGVLACSPHEITSPGGRIIVAGPFIGMKMGRRTMTVESAGCSASGHFLVVRLTRDGKAITPFERVADVQGGPGHSVDVSRTFTEAAWAEARGCEIAMQESAACE